jgi:hypothetical protein
MQRTALVVTLLAITACKEHGAKTQPPPQGSAAGSAAVTPPPPAAPALPDAYARVVGARRATMGSALAQLKLGEAVDPERVPPVPATSFGFLGETDPRVFRRATDDPGPKVMVDLEIRGGKLFAIQAELLTDKGAIRDDQCAGVARALETRWGAAPERVWTDPDAHMRVALVDTCKLVFERYVDLAQWIGLEPTAIVPVALVGKPAAELAPRVGAGAKLTEDLTYRDVGVGEHASGATLIDVYLKKNVVTGVGVEAAVAAADRGAIRERISSAFSAKPVRDATTGYDVWATKPPILMLETTKGVRVEVGNLTP